MGGLEKLSNISSVIRVVRGKQVILSNDLAKLYKVEPRALIQSVKRNIERFPEDFMFQLNKKEYDNLKSQIVISRWGGSRRALPYAFTEHGVAMLSSVLKSKTAIQVNIRIMREFVDFRKYLLSHQDVLIKLEALESKIASHDVKILAVFEALKQLVEEDVKDKQKKIGFTP